jgi:NhaP-type Na+/H+ and K+/H+ antiporter
MWPQYFGVIESIPHVNFFHPSRNIMIFFYPCVKIFILLLYYVYHEVFNILLYIYIHAFLQNNFVIKHNVRIEENNVQTGSMNQLMTFCLLEVVSYPSEAPEFTPVGLCFARSSVFCVVFCRSLFVFFSFGHCIVCPSIYCF